MKYVATIDGREYEISLEAEGSVLVDGVHYAVDLQSIDGGFHYSLLVGGASHEAFVERCEDICTVVLGGRRLRVRVEDERIRQTRGRGRAALQDLGAAQVISPMPGVVIAVLVQEGQPVRTGDGLAILEAMKMENEIRAPTGGIVEQVHVNPGQRVSQDAVLFDIGAHG